MRGAASSRAARERATSALAAYSCARLAAAASSAACLLAASALSFTACDSAGHTWLRLCRLNQKNREGPAG